MWHYVEFPLKSKKISSFWNYSILKIVKKNFTSISMPTTKNQTKQIKKRKLLALPRMERNWNLCALLVGMNGTATRENSMSVPKKIKNRNVKWSSKSTLRHISKRTESSIWMKYLHINVHRSIVHSCQKWKQPKYTLMDE